MDNMTEGYFPMEYVISKDDGTTYERWEGTGKRDQSKVYDLFNILKKEIEHPLWTPEEEVYKLLSENKNIVRKSTGDDAADEQWTISRSSTAEFTIELEGKEYVVSVLCMYYKESNWKNQDRESTRYIISLPPSISEENRTAVYAYLSLHASEYLPRETRSLQKNRFEDHQVATVHYVPPGS